VLDSGTDCANAAELRQMSAAHGIDHLRLDAAGLSLARNAAHQHASSDWIVYLDDDAIPEPGWAKSLLIALSDAPADVAIVGGKVTPLWPIGADHTRITNRWKLLLSCVESRGVGLVSEGYNVCGANFAVRRSALELAGRFPTKLGRTGKCLIGGEESYLIDRMSSLGLLSIYNDAFAVQHRIQPERLEIEWVARRAFWEGVTRARIVEELGEPMPAHMRRSKLLVSLPALFALQLLSGNPDYTIRYNVALGSLLAQSGLVH
jgi:glycosyltransferase involved in cell wall biosynthesis